MLESQEPKYKVDLVTGRILDRVTGDEIPDDEPIFIFRGRDALAAETLRHYFHQLEQGAHTLAVWARIRDFDQFAAAHPDRMRVPGTGEPAKVTPKALGKGLGALIGKRMDGGDVAEPPLKFVQVTSTPGHLVGLAADGTVWSMPLGLVGRADSSWTQLPTPDEDA